MPDIPPINLLLVDDEAVLREPLAEYLSGQGFAVRQAASAAEARPMWMRTRSSSLKAGHSIH